VQIEEEYRSAQKDSDPEEGHLPLKVPYRALPKEST